MTLHLSVSARLLLLAAALPAFAHSAAAADVVVYDEAAGSGWQNWSWNSTIDFASTTQHHGGVKSLSLTYGAGWGGLYLHNDAALNQGAYASLQFWIRGGSATDGAVQVTLYDGTLTAAPLAFPLLHRTTTAWTQVTIPLSTFGSFNGISGIAWQENTGATQPAIYIDDIVFVSGTGPTPSPTPPPGTGPALSVDAAAARHAINPEIYGINFGDEAFLQEIHAPVHRWGGNSVTRYNWQNDTSNHAMDWYFENIPNDNAHPENLPNGSSSDVFMDDDKARGSKTLLTVPTIGWTPKSRAYAGAFSVAKYGAQQSVDPYRTDIGNGIHTNGTNVTGNDPTDTSIAIGPDFVKQWIAHIRARQGDAGVRYYALDNEPSLWNSTHRDVYPNGLSYDELLSRAIAYAAAIKQADPNAKTFGPVEWGWTGYLYSAKDITDGGAQWWNTRPDRMAHGDMPLVEWYLAQLKAYDMAHSQRLLDYLDLHFYPESVSLIAAGNAATQAMRLRTTRLLWDPSYTEETWVATPVYLIPRARAWIAANYPGTKLAITEYNWGGQESMNGAVALADVLGIFGREGVDLATIWDPPTPAQPAAYSFRLYRNYDGAGHTFGDTSVQATTADAGTVSVFAAERGSDGALTVMVLNKGTTGLNSSFALEHFNGGSAAQVWTYSPADLSHIVHGADLPIAAGAATLSLAAQSVTLLVIPSAAIGSVDWITR